MEDSPAVRLQKWAEPKFATEVTSIRNSLTNLADQVSLTKLQHDNLNTAIKRLWKLREDLLKHERNLIEKERQS